MGIPGTPASREVRVGDAERDGAAQALSEHFAAGRLRQEEFDARLGAAMSATTYADLDRQFRDLPPLYPVVSPHVAPSPPPPFRDGRPRRRRTPLPIPVILLLVFAFMAGSHAPFFLLIPLVWVWFSRRTPRQRV